MDIYKVLNKGKWERPTDKMAVYTEIEAGKRWGIRVTLLGWSAKVEAIDGPKCSWYKDDTKFTKNVNPPTLFEKLRGITFEEKLMKEIEEKRALAEEMNNSPVSDSGAADAIDSADTADAEKSANETDESTAPDSGAASDDNRR